MEAGTQCSDNQATTIYTINMKKFKVYFIIFGKKLMKKVEATTPYHAQQIVKEKIKFHKTELIEDDPTIEDFRNMFGMK